LTQIIKPDGGVNYRIANTTEGSIYEIRSDKPGFYNFAPHDYPTVYEIPSAAGYEPFVVKSPLFAHIFEALEMQKTKKHYDILRACSVKWIFANGKNKIDEMSKNPDLKKVYQFSDQEIAVFELSSPAPMAYSTKNPNEPVGVTFNAKGAVIDINGIEPGSEMVLSVLNRPGLKLYADKNILDFGTDKAGMVVFRVPAGAKQISLIYEAPWKKGIVAGGIFLILSVLMTASMVYIESAMERSRIDDNNIPQSK
jgi:hypothetical protein